jgi:hypothetical protein
MVAAWVYWLGYGALAWIFAWERVHYDAPYYYLKMLNTGAFTFEHGRTTGPLFEWAPWLAEKWGASLETIVRLHSLNDWWVGFGTFWVLAYTTRSSLAAGAWTFAMAVGYRYNFVVPVSELYSALGILLVAATMRRGAWIPAVWGLTGHVLAVAATWGWALWTTLKYGLRRKTLWALVLSVAAAAYHFGASAGYQWTQATAVVRSTSGTSLALPCPIPPHFKWGWEDGIWAAVTAWEYVVLGIWGLILWRKGRFSRAEAVLFGMAAALAAIFLARPRTLMAWGFDMSERYVFVGLVWAVWALYACAPRSKIWTLVALSSLVQLYLLLHRHHEIRYERLKLLCETMSEYPEQKFLIRESNWVTEKIGTDVGLCGETTLYSMAKYGTVKQAISEEALAVTGGARAGDDEAYWTAGGIQPTKKFRHFDFRPGPTRVLNSDGPNTLSAVERLRAEIRGKRATIYNPGPDTVYSGLCRTPVKFGFESGVAPVPLTQDLPPGGKCTVRIGRGQGRPGFWLAERFIPIPPDDADA